MGRGESVHMETKTKDVKREVCKIQRCHIIKAPDMVQSVHFG